MDNVVLLPLPFGPEIPQLDGELVAVSPDSNERGTSSPLLTRWHLYA